MRFFVFLIWVLACLAVAKAGEECCPDNEEYSECGANACQNTCENPTLSHVCKAPCTPGCVCVEGYLRNANGVCVAECDCPVPTKPPTKKTTTKPTKKTTPAPCDDDEPPTKKTTPAPCDDDEPPTKKTTPKPTKKTTPAPCDDDEPPTKKTTTKKTTTKKTTTTCKPTKPSCPKNEVYSECGNHGCQDTCENPNISKVSKCACIPGCICKEGYLRNTKGVCVKASECDTCGKNEIFDLCRNTECQNTCAAPDLEIRCTSPAGCNAGCICKDGFLRNEKNECVAKDDCGCNGDPNAYFDPCGNACALTCQNKDNPPMCAQVCLSEGACRCREGFVFDFNGKCIRADECPTCSGANEFYDCGSACDTTCATLGEDCPIINVKCNEMCYCKPGFARDADNVCIPIEECPPRQCPTDPNAVIAPCGDPCPTTCENRFQTGPRPCPKICLRNGCKCKPGYVKDEFKLNDIEGKCILIDECPVPTKKTTKKPTTCATKPTKKTTVATKKTTTCATKPTKKTTTCAPKVTKKPTTCATKATKPPTKKVTKKPYSSTSTSTSYSYSYSYSYSFSSSSSYENFLKNPVLIKKPPTCQPKITKKPPPMMCDLY